MSRPTAIDLFAGAGGASRGLRDAGFRVLAAVENDRHAAATYEANHAGTRVLHHDVRAIDPDLLRRELGLAAGELTLLKACPPCQGYSSLGKEDPEDERNDLVHEVERFVAAFRPAALLMENVPRLKVDRRLRALESKLTHEGYGLRSYEVDAADFGVPQRRRRIIVVGLRGRDAGALPDDLAAALPSGFAPGPATVAEAFAMIRADDPLHRWRNLSDPVRARVEAIPVGGSRFDLPAEHHLPCHRKLGTRVATASYGRMRLEDRAPTLTTRCTTPSCGTFVHPTEHRGISLREAALLQTFPPDYAFHGGYDAVERQIGNAEPVKMADGLSRIVLDFFRPSKW